MINDNFRCKRFVNNNIWTGILQEPTFESHITRKPIILSTDNFENRFDCLSVEKVTKFWHHDKLKTSLETKPDKTTQKKKEDSPSYYDKLCMASSAARHY